MSNQPVQDGWHKVFEGDVWEARILQNELEGEGVPAVVTEPHYYTPNPIVSGVSGPSSSVFVPPDRVDDARRIVEHVN